jgi:hypothetical protein
VSQLGLGVMIQMLGGNKSSAVAVESCIGKTIKELKIDDNHFQLFFDEGYLDLWDDGQSCCEYRHMYCDDDLSFFTGAKLQGIKIKDGPSKDNDGDVSECQFLIIETDKGEITVANHNEHNGYYGGFYIKAEFK